MERVPERWAGSQQYSAEAHGFSRAEEARKLHETNYRYRHSPLPHAVKNINK
jgi:hypothetical protein